jgi:hypothetical protein
MIKNYLLATITFLILCVTTKAQTYTETFESYTSAAGKPTTFTTGGQPFTLVSADCTTGGTFGIFIPNQTYTLCGNGSGSGVTSGSGAYGVGTTCTAGNCTGTSNNFIDNGASSPSSSTNQQYSIKTTNAALFTIKNLQIYVSADAGTDPASSGVVFVGKKASVGQFTVTMASGLNTSFSTNNGFTYVDFTTQGGNNSTTNIDELQITGSGGENYIAVDNFSFGSAVTPLSATTSQTNIACFGGSTGAASVSASNGTPSYSYAWAPSGGTGATATGLTAGNYTCTITDAASTSITKVFLITQPSSGLSATTSSTNVSCNGGSNGKAGVSVSGGTPSYLYAWAPSGGTGANATGLAAGNYTCTITDANNCTFSKIVPVIQPSAISATTNSIAVSCFGGSNGSAQVTPSGGTPSYLYAWAPSGGTSQTANGLTAGNYTCTITDNNSCTFAKVVTVSQPTAALSATTSFTNVLCNGSSNGKASVSASGGTGTPTYAWAPSGGTAAIASGLAAGNYTCTITDVNSCSVTKVVTVSQPTSAVTASSSFTAVSCFGGSNGIASVNAFGGTGTLTYSWSPSGGTGATASGLTAGTYTCVITDANNCTNTKSAAVSQPTAAISASSSSTNVSCFGGSNGTAGVTASGGTPGYSYAWAPSGGTNATASGLAAGSYTCTITDNRSCTFTKAVAVSQPTAAVSATTSFTNVACNGGSNGVASVSASGGTPSYNYTWTPSGGNSATASGLTAGSYTCTITDNNSCTATKVVAVSQPTAAISATPSSTGVSCFGGSNGTAGVTASGGTPSYLYAWAPSGGTGATASGLTAGSYTCTITDNNSCTTTRVIAVSQPTAAVSATTSFTNVACNSGSNGAASVSASGGTPSYLYSWAPSGGTGATASGLTAGNYTCTITDNNSCTATKVVAVSQPTAALSATTTQTNVACFGNATAVANVNVSGGTTTYGYAWSPSGGSGATASSLTSGNYTCTITDAHNCSIAKTFTITQPSTGLSAITSQTNVACNGGNNAIAGVSASGGTGTLSYAWAPSGGSNATASGLTAGNYTCTISDASACSSIKTFTITQPNVLMASATAGAVSCNGGVTTVTVSATGGTTNYTGTGTFTTTAGTYTYNVSDANSCATTTTLTITQPNVLMASSTSGTIACNGGATTVTVTATGGTTTYSNTGTYTVTANSYTYTVIDANQCTATTTITVSQPALLQASATAGAISCNGGVTTVTVSATGGTTNYTGTGTFTTTAGTYTYNVSDANSCATTTTLTITQPNVLMASSTSGTIACNGGATTVTVTATGGTTTYSNTGTYTVTANSYTYTVIDANQCTATTTITVSQPNPVDASVNVSGGTISANNASATYQWVDCNNSNAPISGATSQSFSPVSSGNYAVVVTEGSCSATSTCTPISTTGIAQNKTANSLQVYPNPFSNQLTIVSSTKTTAMLFDMLGNQIKSFELEAATQTINVGELAPGMYYLQVDTQKIKIMKQ